MLKAKGAECSKLKAEREKPRKREAGKVRRWEAGKPEAKGLKAWRLGGEKGESSKVKAESSKVIGIGQ
jgi:hypothetical protein